jgi:hypothetical protein
MEARKKSDRILPSCRFCFGLSVSLPAGVLLRGLLHAFSEKGFELGAESQTSSILARTAGWTFSILDVAGRNGAGAVRLRPVGDRSCMKVNPRAEFRANCLRRKELDSGPRCHQTDVVKKCV